MLVRTYPVTFPDDRTLRPDVHEWDQLTYAARGFMGIETADTRWLVPPHRAIWIPAGTVHVELMYGPVSVRSLFLATAVTRQLPRTLCTFEISPLLRELVLHVCRIGSLDRRIRAQAHLISVLVDQLTTVSDVPLQLPWPRDGRARRVAEWLQARPGDPRSTRALAKMAGASARTLERAFSLETGMAFGEWRRRCRLLYAMRLLVRESSTRGVSSVTEVALETGYASTSAFVSAFKALFGLTPGQYAARARV